MFWRGRDRAPFTYAGVGGAQGAWGEKPVEVLWRFDDAPAPNSAGSESTLAPTGLGRAAFQHGPPPSFGFKQMLAEDGECHLYLMVLEGIVDALFPDLSPTASKRSIVKVGISRDPGRRQREINVGFPKGATARWVVRKTRRFATAGDAFTAEGALLSQLADTDRWISGEFAVVSDDDLDTLLG